MRPGLPCAVEQVGQEMLARRRLPRLEPQAGEEDGTNREAQRVDGVDHARFEDRHQDTRQRRPTDVCRALRDLQQCVGLLKPRVADRFGNEARGRRREERLRRTNQRRGHDEHPDLHDPCEQRDGYCRLHCGPDRVASEHHQSSRKAVRPDSADDDEAGAGERERREDETELGSAAADLDHRERQRHVDHRVADGGGGLTEPQQPELPLLERSQPAHEPTIAAFPPVASFRFGLAKGMQRKELVTVASIRQRP